MDSSTIKSVLLLYMFTVIVKTYSESKILLGNCLEKSVLCINLGVSMH